MTDAYTYTEMKPALDAAFRKAHPVVETLPMPDGRAWCLDDERRDAAVQAGVTEYYTFTMPSLNAHAFAFAAFCEEVARQKAAAGECDATWATFAQMAQRLRAP